MPIKFIILKYSKIFNLPSLRRRCKTLSRLLPSRFLRSFLKIKFPRWSLWISPLPKPQLLKWWFLKKLKNRRRISFKRQLRKFTRLVNTQCILHTYLHSLPYFLSVTVCSLYTTKKSGALLQLKANISSQHNWLSHSMTSTGSWHLE